MTSEIFDATVPGGNGVFRATVLNDGEVVGLWTLKKLAKRQEVTTTWFPGRPVPSASKLDTAVGRYAAFCDIPTDLAGATSPE